MPKNQPIEYEAAEPAFLRRLKAGNAGLDGRHNVQIPRARGGMGKNGRLDMQGEDGEDDPVMLDEAGNVVSKEEMENLEKETEAEKLDDSVKQTTDGHRSKEDEETGIKETKDSNVTSGFGKKRKVAKVVGESDPNESHDQKEEATSEEPVKSLNESTQDLKSVVTRNKESANQEVTNTAGVKKGKRKKIKLSFDELE